MNRSRSKNLDYFQHHGTNHRIEIRPENINTINNKNKLENRLENRKKNTPPIDEPTTRYRNRTGTVRSSATPTTCDMDQGCGQLTVISIPASVQDHYDGRMWMRSKKKTVGHFLLNCELFDEKRDVLRRKIWIQSVRTNVLLGDSTIIKNTEKYIESTGCFKREPWWSPHERRPEIGGNGENENH